MHTFHLRPPLPSLARCTLFLALAATAAEGQVIRSYESLDRSAGEGWYGTAALGFDGSVGNTEKAEFDVHGAVGHRGDRHWIRLYPSYLVTRAGGATTEHERALHLRHSYRFSDRVSSYAFVQIQADEALALDRRLLVGGGMRRRVMALEGGGVDVGIGAMWEEERTSDGSVDRSVRGANLVSVLGSAGIVELTLTGFFQPVLDAWGDHRLALAGSAAVPLGERWAFEVAVRWRRDSRPPPEVEKDDAGLSVGVRFAVR